MFLFVAVVVVVGDGGAAAAAAAAVVVVVVVVVVVMLLSIFQPCYNVGKNCFWNNIPQSRQQQQQQLPSFVVTASCIAS